MCRPTALSLVLLSSLSAAAADQTVPGAGNAQAAATAAASPRVRRAMHFLGEQAEKIRGSQLREETLDVLSAGACVLHRRGVDDAAKNAILAQLLGQALLNPADAASVTGGVKAGVFPPVLDEGTACPKAPQPFSSAPGSAFGGHHSYPGGLPIHESFNERSDVSFADNYRRNYRATREDRTTDDDGQQDRFFIDEDIILAAPLWHDVEKSLVFQWNADGTEFTELNFGGTGTNDAWGAPGDSRTGGHHILSIAEAMVRGLSPAMVITQACAHSAPTSGNEFKVVNWLRAAAILAQIDPVATGYLEVDAKGHLRLPPLRQTGSVDLTSQLNLLAEYTIHNLSDADFTFTGPSVSIVQILLADLAPGYGYSPADVAHYNRAYRNVALSHLSAERLLILYTQGGLAAVKAELDGLRRAGLL